MPAYAKDGQVVCFFQSAQKFRTRYATLGFSDAAHLDDGHLWPTAFALTELTAADEERIGVLVKQAAGCGLRSPPGPVLRGTALAVRPGLEYDRMDVKRSRGPFRWLTVASSEDPDGTELQLALNDDPAAEAFQQALFQQGQPAVMFSTGDFKGDYERIKARGSEFTRPPTRLTTSPGSVPWSSSSSRGGPSGTSPWPSVHAPDLSIARGRSFPWARSARNPRARSARSPLEGRHARRPTSVSIVTKESAEA